MDIRVVEVAPSFAAVIRIMVDPADIPNQVMTLVDQVQAYLREAGVTGQGSAIRIFHRQPNRSQVELETGVLVEASFESNSHVLCTTVPAGRAAVGEYRGDYGHLPKAHASIEAWCAIRGIENTGDSWEVYGDWQEDPNQRTTQVFHLISPESDLSGLD